MTRIPRHRRGLPADGTGPDLDAFETLNPSRRRRRLHTRARLPRDPRTARRTLATALRATRPRAGLHWPARSHRPAN